MLQNQTNIKHKRTKTLLTHTGTQNGKKIVWVMDHTSYKVPDILQ